MEIQWKTKRTAQKQANSNKQESNQAQSGPTTQTCVWVKALPGMYPYFFILLTPYENVSCSF